MKQFQSLKRLLFFYTLTLLIMLLLYYATFFHELRTHNKQHSIEAFNVLKHELTDLVNPTNSEVKRLLKKPFMEDYSYQIIFMQASGQTFIHQSTRRDEPKFSTITFPNTDNISPSSSPYQMTNRILSAQLNFESGEKIYIVLRHKPIHIAWISYQFWLPLIAAITLFIFALSYILKRRDDWEQLLAYSDNLATVTSKNYTPQPLHNKKTTIEFLRLGHSLSRISYQLHTRNQRIKTLSHRLKRLVDHAPLPILMMTRQGSISFFNQRFEQVFTTTFQDGTSYTLTDFVMGSDKATQQQLHNLSAQRINRTLLVYALEDKQAYQLHISPWFGEHEQIHGFTVLLSNIDQTITQNTALQQKNSLLNQQIADMSKLRAVMSHELRTPLNAIIGTLDLVAPETLTYEQKDVLDTLMQSSHSMLMMLNDMLDIAKMDAGKLEIKQEPTDIFMLSQHVGNVMAGNARRRNLELLNLFMPDSPRYIDTDSTRLRQILLNLLDNTIKFTRSGYVALVVAPISHFEIQQILNIKDESNKDADSDIAPITIDNPMFQLHSINSRQLLHNATDQQQAWVCFSVQDTGIGISTEEQQQLFGYFNQANAQISQQFGGSGLGLAISNSFAQLLGGFIQLTSEKGSGSHFNLYLPSQSPNYQPVYHRYPEFAHIHLIAIISQPLGIIYLQRLCEYLSIKASIYSSFGTVAAQQLSQQLQQEAQTYVPILLLDYEYYTDHVAVDISASKTLENTNNALKSFIKSTHLPKILLSMTSERGMSSTFLDEFDSFLTKPLDTALLLSEMIRLAQPTLSKLARHSPTFISEETAPNRANDNAELTSVQDSVETPTLAADSACENVAIKPLILVVEDNLTNQKITCKLLEKIGYRSIVAEDGEQALTVLAAQRAEIALVLMDCRMPVMDGLQATKAIRERGDDITVIALTANNTDEDKSECLAVGMDDFLAKPINKNKLQAMLQHHISP